MEDVLAKIKEAFKTALSVDPESINIDTKPSDVPPWDSLGHVSLVSSLERALGIRFDVDEIMEMENVRQIVKIVQAKTGAQPA